MQKKVTDFENLVYEKIKEVPKGKITTYKLVAEAIEKPNASRAVGTALKNNPFAPIVPCHRILPSNYKIGGFFGETDTNSDNVQNKIKILKKEGIEFDNNEIKKDTDYRKNITHTFVENKETK